MLQLFVAMLLASAGATLQGTVRAEGSREPVSQARVAIPELDRSVASDAQGYFVMADIPEGRWLVEASALGYDTVELTVFHPDGEPGSHHTGKHNSCGRGRGDQR